MCEQQRSDSVETDETTNGTSLPANNMFSHLSLVILLLLRCSTQALEKRGRQDVRELENHGEKSGEQTHHHYLLVFTEKKRKKMNQNHKRRESTESGCPGRRAIFLSVDVIYPWIHCRTQFRWSYCWTYGNLFE